MVGHEVELLVAQGGGDEMDAYERLLGDAMNGDAALFAREDAIETQWRIVAPILDSAPQPLAYQAGSWGPAEAERLMDRPGGWHKPEPASPKGPA